MKKHICNSFTSGIYTFLLIVVTYFLICKITNISIAADIRHYKQRIVSKKIFLNRLTELEYQYLLFIVIVFTWKVLSTLLSHFERFQSSFCLRLLTRCFMIYSHQQKFKTTPQKLIIFQPDVLLRQLIISIASSCLF